MDEKEKAVDREAAPVIEVVACNRADLAEPREGFTMIKCRLCRIPIFASPKSLEMRERGAYLVCLRCAADLYVKRKRYNKPTKLNGRFADSP